MKKITYQDISLKTGVSLATISRIMKGNGTVNKDLYDRVMKAAEEMGYEASKKKETKEYPAEKLIIIEVPSVVNPFYTDIIRGVNKKAVASGYSVLLHESAKTNPTEELIKILKATRASGVISTINLEKKQEIMKLVPLVQCSEKSEDEDVSFVSIDDIHATEKAMYFLLSHGNNRIAFINGPLEFKYAQYRLNGFEEVIQKEGRRIIPDLVTSLPSINYDIAYSAAHTLFSKQKKPDAIFAASDVIAIAFLNAAKSYHIRVPEDLEIIGFDDIDMARMVSPSLTTLRQPCFQMGLNSCEMLVEAIEKNDVPIQKLLLPTELIIRESTR